MEKGGYQCGICSQVFRTFASLNHHLTSHVSKTTMKCPMCTEMFVSEATLNKHIMSSHGVQYLMPTAKFSAQPIAKVSAKPTAKVFAKLTEKVCATPTAKVSAQLTAKVSAKPIGKANYECGKCHRKFHKFQNLQYHMIAHTQESKHKCPECAKDFSNAEDLKSHRQTHRRQSHRCSVCTQVFPNQGDLNNHKCLQETKQHYACTICGKRFPQVASRNMHMKRVHTKQSSVPESVRDASGAVHLKWNGLGDVDVDFQVKPSKEETSGPNGVESSHDISWPESTAASKDSTDADSVKLLPVVSEARSSTLPSEECSEPKFIKLSPDITCSNITASSDKGGNGSLVVKQPSNILSPSSSTSSGVDASFINSSSSPTNKSALKSPPKHLSSYFQKRPFRCNTCSACFPKKHQLTRHMHTHNKVWPFKCPKCPEQFLSIYKFGKHLRLHKGDFPFSCNDCPRKFKHYQKLIVHMVDHYGQKRFKCEVCADQFVFESLLRHHVNAEHSTSIVTNGFSVQNNDTPSSTVAVQIEENGKPIQDLLDASPVIANDASSSSFVKMKIGDSSTSSSLSVQKKNSSSSVVPTVTDNESDVNFGRQKIVSGTNQNSNNQGNAIGLKSNTTLPRAKAITPNNQLAIEDDEEEDSPRQCRYCSAQFWDVSNLKRHERTHSFSREDIIDDLNEEEEEPQFFKCKYCSRSFRDQSSLKLHSEKHSSAAGGLGKGYRCKECPAQFKDFDLFEAHLLNHSEDNTPFKCKQCPEHFSCQSHLLKHILAQHRRGSSFLIKSVDTVNKTANVIVKPAKTLNKSAAALPKERPWKFDCDICHRVFSTEEKLFQHMQSKHPPDSLPMQQSIAKGVNNITGRSTLVDLTVSPKESCYLDPAKESLVVDLVPVKPNVQKVVETKPGGPALYRCHVCLKTFTYKKTMLAHLKTHHLVEEGASNEIIVDMFKCGQCSAKFNNVNRLNSHVISHFKNGRTLAKQSPSQNDDNSIFGRKERVAECELCGERVASHSRKQHVEKHAKRKPLQCGLCSASFVGVKDLMSHKKTHDGEQEHTRCPLCHEKFHRTVDLRIHFKKSHSGENKYTCTYCSACFCTRAFLECHMVRHGAQKQSFKGQLPFTDCPDLCSNVTEDMVKCNICASCFKGKPAAIDHIMLQHSQTGFCLYCGGKFSRKKDLHSHLKNIHSHTPSVEDPSRVIVIQPTSEAESANLSKAQSTKPSSVPGVLKYLTMDVKSILDMNTQKKHAVGHAPVPIKAHAVTTLQPGNPKMAITQVNTPLRMGTVSATPRASLTPLGPQKGERYCKLIKDDISSFSNADLLAEALSRRNIFHCNCGLLFLKKVLFDGHNCCYREQLTLFEECSYCIQSSAIGVPVISCNRPK